MLRIERLADDLARHLRDGHVIVEVDRVDSVEEWRAATRVAARRHGWKVRTGMSRGNGRVFGCGSIPRPSGAGPAGPDDVLPGDSTVFGSPDQSYNERARVFVA